MKKYVMNKNVEHNGKPYSKGQEIKPSDEGFKSIVQAGHADEIGFSNDEPSMPPKAEVEVESKSEEQPEQPSKSRKQSKK